MTEYSQPKSHGTVKAIIIAVAVFLITCITLMWSWNTLAVDLFQLPNARFKHALAAGFILLGVFMFRILANRLARSRPTQSRHHQAGAS